MDNLWTSLAFTFWFCNKQNMQRRARPRSPGRIRMIVCIARAVVMSFTAAWLAGTCPLVARAGDNCIELASGVTMTDIAGGPDSIECYRVEVPHGACKLTIQTSGGNGDCDLYVRFEEPATLAEYDYRPFLQGNNESVLVPNPSPGTWYIAVHGFNAYTGVSIVAGVAEGIGDSVDADAMVWNVSQWNCDNEVSHDGDDAVRSDDIGNNKTAFFETTVTGPGSVSFWWKVSSQPGADVLAFAIDGVVASGISGEQDWQQKTLLIPDGEHVLRWSYAKDGSDNAGADAGWVDQVVWTEGPVSPLDGQWLKVGAKCKKNCRLKAKFTLRNSRATALQPTLLRFVLSGDAAFDAADTVLFQEMIEELKIGRKLKQTLKNTLPEGTEVTGQFILAVVGAAGDERVRVLAVFGPLP